MADIDLDKIIAQREEARATNGDATEYIFEFGDEEPRIKGEGEVFSFRFVGRDWVVIDPQFLGDDEKDWLRDIDDDVDIAIWYMGETQYDEFVEAGGSSSIFFQGFRAYTKELQDDVSGKPTRPNRSSRRRAARKR